MEVAAMKSNALYKKLLAVLENNCIETPEKGFKTTKQWAKEFGVACRTMRKNIKRLKKLGRCESKRFKVRQGVRNVAMTTHYKINL